MPARGILLVNDTTGQDRRTGKDVVVPKGTVLLNLYQMPSGPDTYSAMARVDGREVTLQLRQRDFY